MRKMVVVAAGVMMAAMLGATVLAGQNDMAPAVRQPVQQPESPAMAGSQTDSGKTGLSERNRAKTVLSNHNKAMIEQAEQRKLRQIEINREQVADPQSK